MRLVIANDLDEWIIRKIDVRAWAQRMLWFVQEQDIFVLMSEPDKSFVEYIGLLKGIDVSTVKFHVLPYNSLNEKMFDHLALLDPELIAAVSKDVAEVTEVLAAWPSPHIAEFVERVGLAQKWPAQAIFAQGACELLNSMGSFRAFAAAAGVSIADGTVCRSKKDVIHATKTFLSKTRAVMIKKAHGGAGAGNHIVTLEPDLDAGHSGGVHLTVLPDLGDAVSDFWESRWDWASYSGAYPVVVENYQRDAKSVYVEYECTGVRVLFRAIGELVFLRRNLASETLPFTEIEETIRLKLLDESYKIATYYWQLGYRGPLSCDAVIDNEGRIFFTEVNAQFTGSTHLHSVLVGKLAVKGGKVTQMTSPESWPIRNTLDFINALHEVGCAYNKNTRKGVVAVTPKIGQSEIGPIIFAAIYSDESEFDGYIEQLNALFRKRNAAVSLPDR